MPGAGRFRGGIGVVKAQRVLTDAFITHENDRHHDVPWGIFGGSPGQVGKVDIYNIARPNDVKHMPAKFSGMRVAPGDVHVFYGPCGGGFGEPLERPATKVLDDVLDGFCTVEHARIAYGVIVDAGAEAVDEAATTALRERLRGALRSKPATTTAPPQTTTSRRAAGPSLRQAPTPSRLMSRSGASPLSPRWIRPIASPHHAPPPVTHRNARSVRDVVRGLREAYGDTWSFEIVQHSAYGNMIEVVGQLRANGLAVSETAVAGQAPGCSLGELLERAANDSLCKCVETLMRNGH
jgi:hypothetical protein